jgi:hypothetical protein
MALHKYISNGEKKSKAEKRTEDMGFKATPTEAKTYAAYAHAAGDSFSNICRKAWKEYMRRHPVKKS